MCAISVRVFMFRNCIRLVWSVVCEIFSLSPMEIFLTMRAFFWTPFYSSYLICVIIGFTMTFIIYFYLRLISQKCIALKARTNVIWNSFFSIDHLKPIFERSHRTMDFILSERTYAKHHDRYQVNLFRIQAFLGVHPNLRGVGSSL